VQSLSFGEKSSQTRNVRASEYRDHPCCVCHRDHFHHHNDNDSNSTPNNNPSVDIDHLDVANRNIASINIRSEAVTSIRCDQHALNCHVHTTSSYASSWLFRSQAPEATHSATHTHKFSSTFYNITAASAKSTT
jgi:hypothetical protein